MQKYISRTAFAVEVHPRCKGEECSDGIQTRGVIRCQRKGGRGGVVSFIPYLQGKFEGSPRARKIWASRKLLFALFGPSEKREWVEAAPPPHRNYGPDSNALLLT